MALHDRERDIVVFVTANDVHRCFDIREDLERLVFLCAGRGSTALTFS
jgi:hypothetical protein